MIPWESNKKLALMQRSPVRWLVQNLTALIFLVLLLVVWEHGVRIFEVKEYLLPPPTMIWKAAVENWEFLQLHLIGTIQTVLLGFVIALALAIVLALAMFFSPVVARAMQPLLVVSQTLPTVITAPLLLIWVGPNLTTKVTAAVLNAFFPLLVALYDGLRSPEQEMVDMFTAAGSTRWQLFWKLRLPASLPMLFSAMKIASISALTGSVVGELVVGRIGLGHYARTMAAYLDMAEVFAAVGLISLVGVSFYLAISVLERLALPWYFANKTME